MYIYNVIILLCIFNNNTSRINNKISIKKMNLGIDLIQIFLCNRLT